MPAHRYTPNQPPVPGEDGQPSSPALPRTDPLDLDIPSARAASPEFTGLDAPGPGTRRDAPHAGTSPGYPYPEISAAGLPRADDSPRPAGGPTGSRIDAVLAGLSDADDPLTWQPPKDDPLAWRPRTDDPLPGARTDDLLADRP
ncbi:MAG: hypothetical protein ABJB47_07715, partial [Actinomycetota bacterium]